MSKDGDDKAINWDNLTTRDNYYESVSFEEFLVDQKNWDKSEKYEQQKIGRYPYGFRHLENFANYSQVNRNSNIGEYMEEMNRPCELVDYVNIMRQHLIEES